ncbi:S9 family peptidase [Actinomadura sp. WMMB 499]|uniref:S9 family peptidase n=1 Tax=Actinomadura sp. WMMB 499 TaxID=1219491 RepID=UPI0012491F95|nr:S9 family peptidase [Actinomadura sp. WMMB 499]QFG22899.1 S9 family peptidase [Actinomadura sp. WMMB 499]
MPGYKDFVPRQSFQPTLALSPDATLVAYSGNTSGQYDLWIVPATGGESRRLTDLAGQAVRNVAWSPDGKYLVFTADREGDEQYRLYRVGVDDEQPIDISTGPHCQRVLASSPFDASGRFLAYAANDRDRAVQDVLVRDLDDDSERRFIPPPGVVFEPAEISPDGRWLLTAGFRSNSDVALYLIDLQSKAEPFCVTSRHGEGLYEPGPWMADSSGFHLITDRWGEFKAVGRYLIDEGTLEPVVQHDWDVEHIDAAGDTLLWSVNQDGRSILHARHDGEPLPIPPLPSGVITAGALAPGASPVAVLLDSATRPTEIVVLAPEDGPRYLTDTRPPAIKTITAVEPESVVYPASAGRRVHALLYRPNQPGPHPVVLSIHGGPEAQERPRYARRGLYQYLLDRGVAVFAPNIAGSTGYGRSHQRLIYRDWGGIDLDDLDHATRYLQDAPDLDADRVAVMGGSYGGFAALSCLARLPFTWAAGVSICGPTNLLTLAQACPPTWRHFVDVVLGNPETDAQHLTDRSPVTYADNITAPLLILQGARDPRVPQAESDQLVHRLRSRGVDVLYNVYADEGHGFTNRANEVQAHEEIADFLIRHLLTSR